MMAVGFVEVLLLLFLSTGGQSTDLVSFVDPEIYFRSREIEVTVPKMVELAAAKPSSGKAELRQLVALRYLAKHADLLKKDAGLAEHRQVLEAIATGQKGRDSNGFSTSYAEKVLRRLDGKPAAAAKGEPLGHGLTWFPASVRLVACMDFRRATPQGDGAQDAWSSILKLMPQRERQKFFDFAEATGNFRVDRVSLAVEQRDDDDMSGDGAVLFRFTGKMTRDWFSQRLEDEFEMNLADDAPEAGDDATVLIPKRRQGVSIALVGDNDVLMALGKTDKRSRAALKSAFALRNKKGEHAGNGPLKSRLEAFSGRATALVVGKLPEPMVKELTRSGQFGAVPRFVAGQMLHNPQGVDIELKGDFENGEGATKFVQSVSKMRADGLQLLKNLEGGADVPPQVNLGAVRKLIESIQVQGKEAQADFRVHVSVELITSLPTIIRSAAGDVELKKD